MSKDRSYRGIRKYLTATLLPVIILAAALNAAGGCGSGKERDNNMRIQELIESFRDGEEFSGDLSDLIINNRPDKVVLDRCRGALAAEEEPVREQVIHLLAAIGKRVDPLFDKGGDMIRDRSIVTILVDDGLRRQNAARDLTLNLLQYSVPADVLKGFGKQLADNLKRWPDATLLLVIAKAKSIEASETVDSLMEIPGWAKEKETQAAAAALGDREIEKEFIRRFEEASDPREKADAALLLGYIGTKAALSALASGMRSDLVIEMPGVSRRSVRVFIIEALSYNYPEKTFLYDNAVNSDEDYAVIEKFCEETYGVQWKKERPPFLWIEGFPSERLSE